MNYQHYNINYNIKLAAKYKLVHELKNSEGEIEDRETGD